MAGEFVAGAIVSKILLDIQKWGSSVTKVKSDTKAMGGMSDKTAGSFRKMGAGMTIAGAAIIGATTKMIGKFVETGDVIDKMSKRTGMSAVSLSELAHAADISGTTLGSVEKGIKKMSKSLVDADLGLETYTRSFDRLGLSVDELMKMSPEDQFMIIGEAMAGLESDTLRAATAQEIFGRAGMELIPLFKEGEGGIRALREEAHTLGVVYDTEMAASAAKLKDEQTRLKESFQGVGIALASTLAPALADITEKITGVITKVSDWARENPGLAGTIMKVTVGLGGLLTVLGPMVMILPRLIGGIRGMAVGVKALGLAMKTALGPIGLVTVAIVAAGVALNSWINAKKKALDADMDAMVADKSVGNALKARRKLIEDNVITQEEWTALVKKFGGDYGAVMKAIDTDPALSNLKVAIEGITGSQTDAGESAKLLGEEEDGLASKFEDLGNTIKELESPFDNFVMQQLQLAQAFGDGEIGMGQYVKRMADLRAEREKNLALFDEEEFAIDDSIEGVESYIAEWESVPSALGSVLDQVGINVVGINDDISSSTETTATNVRNKWTEATDGMITDWSQMFGAFVMSGDLFKGDFTGLFDGIKNVFSDTLGNMLAMFTQDFVQGILSGGTDILGGIGSIFKSTAAAGTDAMGGATSSILGNFGTMAGPLGIGLLAVQLIGMENISKTVQGVWNAVSDVVIGNIKAIGEFGQKILGGLGDMLGGIMSGIGGLAGALGGLGGKKSVLSTTDQWNLDHIQLNTKQLMDYTMIEIGSSGGWLARIHDRLETLIEKNEYQMKQNRKANDHLKGIDKDTGSIRKDVGKMPGLLKDINKGIRGLSGAQEGHVSTKPELVMVHGTPQDPELIMRSSQIRDMMGGRGGGGSNISIVMPSEFNVNGTIIGDREYMRSRLFPEFISMLKSQFGKSELKSILGVS